MPLPPPTPALHSRSDAALAQLARVERYLGQRSTAQPVGCYWRDLDDDSAYWSPSVCSWMGLTPNDGAPGVEAMLGMIEPACVPRMFAALQRCRETRCELTVEYAIRGRDRAVTHLWSTGHIVVEPRRKRTILAGTVVNLTAHQQACDALAEATRMLRPLSRSRSLERAGTGPARRLAPANGPAAAETLSARQCARVSELIESRLPELVSVAEMAAAAGLRPAHFTRAFRRHTGETPYQYALGRKLERARAVLIGLENDKLANVATEFGFFDQAHFTRHFRKRYGLTPGAFMRRHLLSRGEAQHVTLKG